MLLVGLLLVFALFGGYALYRVGNAPKPIVEYRIYDNGGTGMVKADEIRIEGPCVILSLSGKTIAMLCNHDIAIVPNHEEAKPEATQDQKASPSGYGEKPSSTVAASS